MSFSIIQKSQLEGAHRLDAEYYKPEYLKYKKRLDNLNSKTLDQLAKKIDVGFVSSMVSHFHDTGIPLLRTQNVKEFLVDTDRDLVYIDEEFHKKLKKSQIKPGQVLLARSGSIGEACIVPKDFSVANSADIILIETSGNLLPEFLTAFINCKYGKFQIDRGSSGGLQGHINLFSLEKLSIPVFNLELQEKIKEIVSNIFKLSQGSKEYYSQAEELLLEELGLKDFKVEDDLYFAVNASSAKTAIRIDADYFQPKYKRIVEKIKNYNAKVLTEVVENVAARFTPSSDKIYNYVELANINSGIGIIDGSSEVLGKDAPSRAKRILKEGDVIVSSIEGSLEKVALVAKEQEGFIASTGFFQFRSKELLPEVLLVLARSIVLQMQLQKFCAGTILTAVPNEALKNLLIPILPKDVQEEIAELVNKSHDARKKSKELLEEAKRKVEELIENQVV